MSYHRIVTLIRPSKIVLLFHMQHDIFQTLISLNIQSVYRVLVELPVCSHDSSGEIVNNTSRWVKDKDEPGLLVADAILM